MNLNQDSEAPYSIRSVFGGTEGSGVFANAPMPTQGLSLTQALAQFGGGGGIAVGAGALPSGAGTSGVPTEGAGSTVSPLASFFAEASSMFLGRPNTTPTGSGGAAWGGTESRTFSSGNNAATAATAASMPSTQVGGSSSGKGVAVGAGNYQGGFSFTPGGVTIGADGSMQSTGGLGFELPMTTVAQFTNRALDFSSNNSSINRGFLQGVMNNSQSNLNTAQGQVLDFGQGVIKSTEKMTGDILNTQNQIAKRKFSGCFITTAICEKSGLPDDCDVLQTFRHFRDTFMASSENGRAAVADYYRTAPAILARIQARKDGAEILDILRDRFLLPAYDAIKNGDNERARVLYIVMVIAARGFAE